MTFGTELKNELIFSKKKQKKLNKDLILMLFQKSSQSKMYEYRKYQLSSCERWFSETEFLDFDTLSQNCSETPCT